MINAILTDPMQPFNVALSANNVYDWAPQAPTRLVYCTADDQVPFENAILADSVMNANGGADISTYNADPTADHVGCVLPATFFTILFFGTYQQLDDVATTTHAATAGGLEIFPNPAAGEVSLKNLPSDGTLLMMDLNGQTLRSAPVSSDRFTFSLDGISAGMYIRQLTNHEKIWVEKLLVK